MWRKGRPSSVWGVRNEFRQLASASRALSPMSAFKIHNQWIVWMAPVRCCAPGSHSHWRKISYAATQCCPDLSVVFVPGIIWLIANLSVVPFIEDIVTFYIYQTWYEVWQLMRMNWLFYICADKKKHKSFQCTVPTLMLRILFIRLKVVHTVQFMIKINYCSQWVS